MDRLTVYLERYGYLFPLVGFAAATIAFVLGPRLFFGTDRPPPVASITASAVGQAASRPPCLLVFCHPRNTKGDPAHRIHQVNTAAEQSLASSIPGEATGFPCLPARFAGPGFRSRRSA